MALRFTTFAYAAAIALCAIAVLIPLQADAALVRTNLVSARAAATSVVTASFTPSANSLLVAYVYGVDDGGTLAAEHTTLTISGGGLTWTARLGSSVEGQSAGQIFTAPVGSSPASMTVTAGASGWTPVEISVHVVEYTGYNRSSPIGATGTSFEVLNGAITLSSAPAKSSEVFAALGLETGATAEAGAGWTEIFDLETGAHSHTQARGNSNSTSVVWDASFASENEDALAVEIKAAPALAKPANNLGLAAYWSLNEGTSTIATDFSANTNHASYTDGGGGPPNWIKGKRGNAVNLGNTDYFEAPHAASLNITGNLTITGWIRHDDTATASIVGKGDAPSDSQQYIVYIVGNAIQFDFCTGTNAQCSAANGIKTTASNIQVGRWHHFAINYDDAANDVDIYIDGVEEATTVAYGSPETSSIVTSTHPLRLGQMYTNEGINGAIDEIRIYNRTLQASEISRLYQAGAVRFTTSSVALQQGSSLANGLVGHWTFDGPDVTDRVYDRSGQGKNGYVLNTPTSTAKTIGRLGQALQFDGTNDSVDVTSTITIPSAVTFTGWLNLGALVPGGNEVDIFPMNEGDCAIRLEDDETLAFWNNGIAMSPADGKFGGTAFSTNAWRHIAVTIVSTVATTYVDGAVNGSTVDVGATFDCEGVTSIDFAGTALAGRHMNGKLDDVRIYNRALSTDEIKQLYNLGRANVPN